MLAALAAAARSASSQMIIGSDPPSSSVTRFAPRAASAMIRSPTGVEPVNAIFRTRGCLTSASPVAGPLAGHDVEHARRAARPRTAARRTAASSAASSPRAWRPPCCRPPAPAPSLLHSSVVGKFQGTIAPTTPSGRRSTIPSTPGSSSGACAPAQRLRQPDVVHQRVDRLGQLDPRIAQRLALLARQQRDQLVEVLARRGARRRPRISPRSDDRQSRPRARTPPAPRDRGVDVGRSAGGHRRRTPRPSAGLTIGERVARRIACSRAGDERPGVGDVRLGAHAPDELRRALLDERRQALGRVLGAEQLLHQLGLERQPVVERQLAALVHAALDRGDRQRRRPRPAARRTRAPSSRRPRRRTAAPPGRSPAPPRRRACAR